MSALLDIARRLRITRPLVMLDLETTGTVQGLDRIVQIAVQKVKPIVCPRCDDYGVYETGDPPVERLCEACEGNGTRFLETSWSTLVNPQIPIPAEATAIHHITNAMVADAPTFERICAALAAGLSDCDFAGYNVKHFDLPFLKAEFSRVGRPWEFADSHILDGLRIWQQLTPRDLAAAVRHFVKVEHTTAHDAVGDSDATARVIAGMFEAHPDIPTTVKAIHDWCYPRDPNWIDRDGKLAWRGDDACMNVGKYNGTPLRWLVTHDRRYLAFVLRDTFPDDTKTLVRQALDGIYPVRATETA